MTRSTLRIATRKSPLALWQANFIKQRLEQNDPELTVSLVPMVTSGDRFLNDSLSKIGGKGLFVKELERALLDNEADIAVHSMKDVPVDFPQGLMLATICQRDDPHDALVSTHFDSLEALPEGGTVGTSSLRRQSQIKAIRPDLKIVPLRGNINTRLEKSKQFDAIILAAAGLKRMNFDEHIRHIFSSDTLIPAAGQGALGIECRENDTATRDLLTSLHCENTTASVTAERKINQVLNGSCQVPIAAHCYIMPDGLLSLSAFVGHPDGSEQLKANAIDTLDYANDLGLSVANTLIAQGAKKLLASLLDS